MHKAALIAALSTALACLAVSQAAGQQSATKAPGGDKVDAAAARAAFERFKKLAGSWKGQSTKGWTETNSYRVIAKQSVVMGTSFDAHPNETMVTMYHMDGEKLMLTHYCVAKNQPRMVATAISKDASQVTFEFLDGTNLPSRDKGHMDKAIFHFEADDRFTSRWTWYQDGKENWMETIRYTREK